MDASSLLQTPPAAASPVAAPGLAVATPQQRGRIADTAQAFEAQMLAQMMKPMFEGLQTDGPFGGGQAEGSFRSFLLDAFGKQTAKAGGVGLAGPVMKEMLRMQGLQ